MAARDGNVFGPVTEKDFMIYVSRQCKEISFVVFGLLVNRAFKETKYICWHIHGFRTIPNIVFFFAFSNFRILLCLSFSNFFSPLCEIRV